MLNTHALYVTTFIFNTYIYVRKLIDTVNPEVA